MSRPEQTLIYDGDCSFCKAWVEYWKVRTGDRVRYITIDAARTKFPQLRTEDLKRKVHLVTPHGVYSGAEAVFRTLGDNWPLTLYQKLPGFAAVAEFFYGLIARNRGLGMTLTKLLWGAPVVPSDYSGAAIIFSRLLSFIYLIAFASAGTQVRGLLGTEGILPVASFFPAVGAQLGRSAMWRVPSLLWFDQSDYALLSIAWGGAALAAVSIIAKPWGNWQRIVFAALFVYYLSLVSAGQVFMGYQWDFLLLETGFLAIFLRPEFSRVWLFHLLLFRLMLESGAVKLLSGDPSWRNLTALSVHFETQPLPTPLAWYAHQSPAWLLKAATVIMFGVELIAPFLIFGPRRMKQLAGFAIASLQLLILLTGNYTFFNILTIALCVLLFDNAFWARRWKLPKYPASPPGRVASWVLTTFIVVMSAISLAGVFTRLPAPLVALEAAESSFGLVNRYGLFAVMTTKRPEIEIEGSLDGEHWLPLKFRHKAGPLNQNMSWVAPFQPRLDWQMWFAALGTTNDSPWIVPFLLRILEGSKPVLGLMEPGPFGGSPPKLVRGMLYEYRFTSWDERRATGNYWKRELKGAWFPPVGLRATQTLQ
jgi:predicted DCC family thiol-disulfide oxidoreductase YuxK